MPIKDPEKNREYQRQWNRDRRAFWNRVLGPCVQCGNPRPAISKIGIHCNQSPTSARLDKAWKAFKDQVVLCAACSRNKLIAQRKVHNNWHGTNTGYRKGCRCDLCKRAHSRASAGYRWRSKKPGHIPKKFLIEIERAGIPTPKSKQDLRTLLINQVLDGLRVGSKETVEERPAGRPETDSSGNVTPDPVANVDHPHHTEKEDV